MLFNTFGSIGFGMNNDIASRNQFADALFDLIADLVRLGQVDMRIEMDIDADERVSSGSSDFQVVKAFDGRVRLQFLFDDLGYSIRYAVQKNID